MAPTAPTIDYNVAIDSAYATQRIDWEYSRQLVHQRESAFPFISFLSKMATENSATSKIFWFDTRPIPDTDTIASITTPTTSAGTALTFVATNVKFYTPKMIIEFPNVGLASTSYTNKAYVYSVTTGTSTIVCYPIDVTLILANPQAADKVNMLYTNYEQGSETTTPSASRPILAYNASTILRDSYKCAKTTENERMFGAPERGRLRQEKEIKHLTDLAKLSYFGQYVVDDAGSYLTTTQRRTSSKGVVDFISTNVHGYGDKLDALNLPDIMTAVHENVYGGEGANNRRLVFCSSQVMSFFNKLVTDKFMNIKEVANTWGANVTSVQWGSWIWDLVYDPTLTNMRPGWAVGIQPRYIKYRPYRATQFRANIQNPENDYIKDEFLTEPNFEVRLEEMHFVLKP
jgi:hypothetical protein